MSILRARGGSSKKLLAEVGRQVYSPRTRRWVRPSHGGGATFRRPSPGAVCKELVFSAHAEVVPMVGFGYRYPWCILRARGGSSMDNPKAKQVFKYSPRTRR